MDMHGPDNVKRRLLCNDKLIEKALMQGCQNRDFESDRNSDGRIANHKIFTIRIVET